MDWQPIETAPRNGKRVLVSNGKSVWSAYWNIEPSLFEGDTEPCWTVYEPDDCFYAWHLNDELITHWMPLPNPPAQQ